MRTTIDIPSEVMRRTFKNTGAKTKQEAVVSAMIGFNRRVELQALAERIQGSFKDFMTQEELKVMRGDAKAQRTPPWNPNLRLGRRTNSIRQTVKR